MVRSRAMGSYTLPGGACAGTMLDLDKGSGMKPMGDTTVDATGSRTLTLPMPAPACAGLFFQVVDTATCEASNVDDMEEGGFSPAWTYQTGTMDQYTRCGAVTDGGTTCVDPEIKYGSVEGGIPKSHSGNEYDTWCQQLGFSSWSGLVTYGTKTCSPPTTGGLFGCRSYDETEWHWCDWQDGYWHDEQLDYADCTNAITEITCTP